MSSYNVWLVESFLSWSEELNSSLMKTIFRETKTCWSHSDCPAYLRCTNGYCGDKEYFRALQERSCEEDEECEVTTPGRGVLSSGVGVHGSGVGVLDTGVGVFGTGLVVFGSAV